MIREKTKSYLFGVIWKYLEYRCATLDIGCWDIDLPIKSAWSHKGRVEDVHSVRGSQHDHIGRACVETVHLHQKLRQIDSQ